MDRRLSKPPLITPSASPQPLRVPSRRASPLKKQRRTFPESSPTSNSTTQTPAPDVHQEREASRLRLLDVWSSLAERYSRHMDDDDLVDIMTGEIIIDNGVLRNAPTLQFGTLAALVDEATEADDEDEDEDEDENGEDDFDELDAFAETTFDAAEVAKSELDTGGPALPARLLEQTYADDLREFLEAEKKRKEQCGTDVEDESEDVQSFGEDAVHDADEVIYSCEKHPGCSSDEVQDLGSSLPQHNHHSKCIEGHQEFSEPLVATSDDELDFWRAETSNVIQVVQEDEINVIDSDIEIIEPPPLTPRKNLKQPFPELSRGHLSSLDRNNGSHDDSSEVSSSVTPSKRKGKGKERNNVVVPILPDRHSAIQKVRIPVHTEQHAISSGLDESVSKSPSFTKIPGRADFSDGSPKRPRRRPRPHSLKRKRDHSTEDMSEEALEGDSPKKQIASCSRQSSSASATHLSPRKWHSREPCTDSDLEYDQVSQNQPIRRKRSPSRLENQMPPPPHYLYPYATPTHSNHGSHRFTPLPDPRAQLIIAQAVQQLTSLVTGTWQPPPHYFEESSPRTPHCRSMSTQPSGRLYTTPTHPYTHPYHCDPDFSGATLPPETPEYEHHMRTSRRSLVSRSTSRGRKVSFQLDDEESDIQDISPDAYRAPRRSMNPERSPSKTLPPREDSQEESPRVRGQTPGLKSNIRREKQT